MVEERTKAAQAFQDELAKTGAIKEKIDFSNKSARENTGGAAAEAAITKQVEEASLNKMPIDPNSALMAFMSAGPTQGGLKISPKIMQSTTPHHYLGASGSGSSDGIAQAMRGYTERAGGQHQPSARSDWPTAEGFLGGGISVRVSMSVVVCKGGGASFNNTNTTWIQSRVTSFRFYLLRLSVSASCAR